MIYNEFIILTLFDMNLKMPGRDVPVKCMYSFII